MIEVEQIVASFWNRVAKMPDGCWDWIGGAIPEGYGVFYPEPQQPVGAHRYSYELANGPISAGLVIDHLCKRPSCVRPDHLEAVTPRENTLRGDGPSAINARKEACDRGHVFDEANTYRHNGQRLCRACRRAADKAWRDRRKAALT